MSIFIKAFSILKLHSRVGNLKVLLETGKNVGKHLRSPGPWLLSIGFGFYTIQWISLMAWLLSFMIEQRGLPPEMTGLLTALVVIANIAGNLTVGWLFRWGITRSTTLNRHAIRFLYSTPMES